MVQHKLLFKFFLVLLVIFSILFLLSCGVKEEAGTETSETSEETVTETSLGNETGEVAGETTPQTPSGSCTAQWRCVSKFYKAYQYENCTFRDKKECKLGCENGTCKAGVTCDSGFKCKKHYILGFQNEDCTWEKESNCNWGCADAKCKAAPFNTTNTTNVTELMPVEETPAAAAASPASPAVVTGDLLRYGEVTQIKSGDSVHNLSLYNVEYGRVKFKWDDFRSDWINEGQTGNFSGGVKITITEVLFQPYEGGKKEVRYKVS